MNPSELRDYYYPGTRTFVNLLREQDREQLARKEVTISAFAHYKLAGQPYQEGFGIEHLQHNHKILFQDVYPFAGELRAVPMQRSRTGDPTMSVYSHPSEFADLSRLLESRASTVLELSRADFSTQPRQLQMLFVDRMTEVSQLAHQIHPFLKGNSMAIRPFVRELAKQSGWRLRYDRVDGAALHFAESVAVRGELNGTIIPGQTHYLKKMLAHISEHRAVTVNPYVRGKLGELAPSQTMLTMAMLNPIVKEKLRIADTLPRQRGIKL